MQQPIFFALIALTLVPAISFADEQDINGGAAAAAGAGIVAGTAGAIDLGNSFNLIKEDKEAALKMKEAAIPARKEANELAKQLNARVKIVLGDEMVVFRKKHNPLYKTGNSNTREFLADAANLHQKLKNDPEWARLNKEVAEKLEIADAPLLLKYTKKSRPVVRGAGLVTAGAAAYVYGVSEITQEKIEEPARVDVPLVQEEAAGGGAPTSASAELQ